jgi:cytochrome oxidase assembly protein ShyY1
MNSSSSTKATLKSIVAFITSPIGQLQSRPKFWLALILTVVVFSALVKLGFWQLERGQQKQQIENMLEIRLQAAPTLLETLPMRYLANTREGQEKINGNSMELKSSFTSVFDDELYGVAVMQSVSPTNQFYLLDNQTLNKKVGYLVYQLAELPTQHYLLLELGFVPMEKSRDQIPVINGLPNNVEIVGRLYRRSPAPLGSGFTPEQFNNSEQRVTRIQSLDLPAIAAQLDRPLAHLAVQLDNEFSHYPTRWSPLPMKSAKHFGYSLQWFVMAAVFAFVITLSFYRVLVGSNQVKRNENNRRESV